MKLHCGLSRSPRTTRPSCNCSDFKAPRVERCGQAPQATRLDQQRSPSTCSVAPVLVGKGDDRLRDEFFLVSAPSARLRVLQTSSSAFDIAWMSLGSSALSLRNATLVMGGTPHAFHAIRSRAKIRCEYAQKSWQSICREPILRRSSIEAPCRRASMTERCERSRLIGADTLNAQQQESTARVPFSGRVQFARAAPQIADAGLAKASRNIQHAH
jgi:hypothetical protein